MAIAALLVPVAPALTLLAARAAADAPLADAAKKADRAAVRALLDQHARRERAAGRRHDGAALGGLSATTSRRRSCWSAPAPTSKAANRYGVTPLSLACTNGNAAMVELLLEGRRRSERRAARRRDGADDRRAHRASSAR